jgi:hypothetical protein
MAQSNWSAADPVKLAGLASDREDRQKRARAEDRKEAASSAGRGRRRV